MHPNEATSEGFIKKLKKFRSKCGEGQVVCEYPSQES
jgi:hypothetical protein